MVRTFIQSKGEFAEIKNEEETVQLMGNSESNLKFLFIAAEGVTNPLF